MYEYLFKLAEFLDENRLYSEADKVDLMLRKMAELSDEEEGEGEGEEILEAEDQEIG
jgi:hypothetical protein